MSYILSTSEACVYLFRLSSLCTVKLSSSIFTDKTMYILFQVLPPRVHCPICPMTFDNLAAIGAHYDTAHSRPRSRPQSGPRVVECDVCGKSFSRRGNLNKHLKTVHGIGDVKTFQCDICLRVFKHKQGLQGHLKSCVHKCWFRHLSNQSNQLRTCWKHMWCRIFYLLVYQ